MEADPLYYRHLLECHTHAIIDWTSIVSADWHQALPVQPLVPHFFRNTDEDYMPVLLTLDSLDETHRERLVDNLTDAEGSPYMLMLSCLLRASPEVDSDSLACHLTDMLMLNGPGREGRDRLLRYHYSSIFLHLLRILRPNRIRQLFGPVEVWSVPFQREWIAFTPPETNVPTPVYWAVKEKQDQRIECIGLINAILVRYRDETNHRWANVDDFHVDAEKVDRILTFAGQHYRLRDENDLVLFALHSLLYGEGFHRHQKIQELMQTVQAKGWGYAEDSFNVTADDWKHIASHAAKTN
jgi:hypothetical protein